RELALRRHPERGHHAARARALREEGARGGDRLVARYRAGRAARLRRPLPPGQRRTPAIGCGSGRGSTSSPRPSPPPTAAPRPTSNSRTVAAATTESNMSLGPGRKPSKLIWTRVLGSHWRRV